MITSPRSEGAAPSFDVLRTEPVEAEYVANQEDVDVSPLSSGSSGSQNKATGQFEDGMQNSPEGESPQEWQEVQRKKNTGSSTKEEKRPKVSPLGNTYIATTAACSMQCSQAVLSQNISLSWKNNGVELPVCLRVLDACAMHICP